MRTLIISTLIAVCAATPVAADERSRHELITTMETVSVQDLDLHTTRGLRQLHRRINAATEAVCGSLASQDHNGWNRVRHCREQVTRMVEPQLERIMHDRRTVIVSR